MPIINSPEPWQNMIDMQYANTTATRVRNYTGQNAATAPQNKCDTAELSTSNNTCTDGSDDGNISMWDKIKHGVKGFLGGALDIVKGAIKHPIKTALMVGACCIPVVGPIIAGGMAVYGIYKGATTIYNGIQLVNSATSDAEAKDAWENIGNGTFTTAASALALKGSAGALKGQLKGGSTTVKAVAKAAKKGDMSTAELTELAFKKGSEETISNIGKVVEETVNTAQKVKGNFKSVKENGIKDTLQDIGKKVRKDAKKQTKKIKEKTKEDGGVIKSAKKKTESTYKTIKEKFTRKISKKTKKALEGVAKEYKGKSKVKSAKVVKDKVEVTYKGGKVEKYNSEGKLIYSESKNYQLRTKGDIKKETVIDGKKTITTKTNTATGDTITTTVRRNKAGKVKETITEINGKNINKVNSYNTWNAKFNTSNIGYRTNRIIDWETTVKGIDITNNKLMGISAFIPKED